MALDLHCARKVADGSGDYLGFKVNSREATPAPGSFEEILADTDKTEMQTIFVFVLIK